MQFLSSFKNFFQPSPFQAYLNMKIEEMPENLENLIGFEPFELTKLEISEDLATSSDPDEQIQIFKKNLNDSEFIRDEQEDTAYQSINDVVITLQPIE